MKEGTNIMADKKLKLSKDALSQIIRSIILIVLGIAFCFSMASQVISYVIGISLIVSGAVLLTISIMLKKAVLTHEGILAAFAITLGITVIVTTMVNLVVTAVPYLLISVGGILLIEAFMAFLVRKKVAPVAFAFMLIGASAVIALGICFLAINGFATYAGIVLGIALIIAGILTLITAFKKDKKE